MATDESDWEPLADFNAANKYSEYPIVMEIFVESQKRLRLGRDDQDLAFIPSIKVFSELLVYVTKGQQSIYQSANQVFLSRASVRLVSIIIPITYRTANLSFIFIPANQSDNIS
jgi:hypothetical protein